jgi:hypothetical protein
MLDVELEGLLTKCGVENIVLGGSPCVSSGFRKAAKVLEMDETAWMTILRLEEQAYCKKTMVDNGEFLLAKGTKKY